MTEPFAEEIIYKDNSYIVTVGRKKYKADNDLKFLCDCQF